MNEIKHKKQLALIAQDYFLSQMSIADISKKYDISRYLITKSINEALDSGLVKIEINAPVARNFELELTFQKHFGIEHIYILKTAEKPDENSENIIQFASEQASLLINESKVVGLTWGSTIYNMIDHFNGTIRDDLVFTQFLGENMKYNSSAGSTRMVEKAASKFSSKYVTMVGPLYIVNDNVRSSLKNEPALLQAFKYANRMDAIFTGIGTLSSIDSIYAWKNHKQEIFPDVNRDEIAGMVFGRPIDINGTFLNSLNDKTFGIDTETILAVPRRLAVVKSKFKSRAALGALRGHLFTDVIMDESNANRILMEENNN